MIRLFATAVNEGAEHVAAKAPSVSTFVDGNELVKRRGHGKLVRITHSDARPFLNHYAIELRDVNDAAGTMDFAFSPTALVIPGDYRIQFGFSRLAATIAASSCSSG
jgi:hypothetical protein